jgi:hypothetical protein
MTTQAPDLAQRAPGLSVVPPGSPPVKVYPFKPTLDYPDQLRPTPRFLPTASTILAVSLYRGSPNVHVALIAGDWGDSLTMSADQAVCLAWQLMDAADQVNSGGAK